MNITEYITLFAYPILASLLLGGIAGPMGCFVNWRRMAFYSDTLSHAALLGIGLGLLLGIGAMAGVLSMALLMTGFLLLLQRQQELAPDVMLAILAQGSLAGGILLIYWQPDLQVNLYGLLFGDVLAVDITEAALIAFLVLLMLWLLWFFWRPLLLVTLHEELAQADGIRVRRVAALLMAMIALTVAIGIYVTGVMMVSSLLVIPAASARAFATTPRSMAIGAALLGMAAAVFGLLASFHYDLPPGPAIVLASVGMFLLSFVWLSMTRRVGFAGITQGRKSRADRP